MIVIAKYWRIPLKLPCQQPEKIYNNVTVYTNYSKDEVSVNGNTVEPDGYLFVREWYNG